MKITKNKGMYFLSVIILIVVYNVIVFVIPFNRDGGFWTAYGFSIVALLLTAAVIYYAFDKEGLKSKFYRIPLISVVWRYLIIQLVVGLIEMIIFQFIPSISFKYGIAVNTIILGACLVGLLAVEAAKDEIERFDGKIKEKVFYIKSLQVDVESLVDKVIDDSTKKNLKNLIETIQYSDPMSSPQLATIENKIEVKIAILTETVKKSDVNNITTLCNELQQLLAERNRKCKILK